MIMRKEYDTRNRVKYPCGEQIYSRRVRTIGMTARHIVKICMRLECETNSAKDRIRTRMEVLFKVVMCRLCVVLNVEVPQ